MRMVVLHSWLNMLHLAPVTYTLAFASSLHSTLPFFKVHAEVQMCPQPLEDRGL